MGFIGGGGSNSGCTRAESYSHTVNNKQYHLLLALRAAGKVTAGLVESTGKFRYVTNQPPKTNSAFHPSGVGK